MLGLKSPEQVSPSSNYNDTVSLLPAPLSSETIEKYRKSGFKAWGKPGEPIYEYQINVSKNKNAFVGNIKFTSTKEQTDFTNKNNWDNYFKKRGIDTKKIPNDDEYWNKNQEKIFRIRKDYKDAKSKHLTSLIPIITPSNYKDSAWIKKMKNNWKWFLDYNLKHGSKSQYASYIPHIHTEIKLPLKIEKVNKII
jgi:hypothetical protein